MGKKQPITTIRDLFNDSGILLTHQELTHKYNISTNFLHNLQIHNSIPMKWLSQIKNTQQIFTPKTSDIYININNKKLILNNIASKESYWHIINSNKHKPSSIQKWSASYPTLTQELNQEWKNLFNLVFKYSQETKLQSFQFKIIHRPNSMKTLAIKHKNY